MLRFYNPVVRELLLHLIYHRDQFNRRGINEDQDIRSLVRGFGEGFGGNTTELGDAVRRSIYTDQYLTLDEVISTLASALNNQDSEGDQGLIDTIVRILKFPYGTNIISGKTLESLRKSILLPEELATFNSRVRNQEMSCISCGHEFQNAEAVTFYKPGMGSPAQMVCAKCQVPNVLRCSTKDCNHPVSLPASIRKMFNRENLCRTCVDRKKGIEVKEEEGVEPVLDMDGILPATPSDPTPRRRNNAESLYFRGASSPPTSAPTPPPMSESLGERLRAAGSRVRRTELSHLDEGDVLPNNTPTRIIEDGETIAGIIRSHLSAPTPPPSSLWGQGWRAEEGARDAERRRREFIETTGIEYAPTITSTPPLPNSNQTLLNNGTTIDWGVNEGGQGTESVMQDEVARLDDFFRDEYLYEYLDAEDEL